MAQRMRRYERTEVLDHQSGSEGLEEAGTGDECSPLHFIDIFDGKNRPMNAMDWCGWSTSSFENPLRNVDALGRVSAAEAVMSR